MKPENTDPKITAIERLKVKSAELHHRARAVEELLVLNGPENFGFWLEMLRESATAIDFWLSQLEKATRT